MSVLANTKVFFRVRLLLIDRLNAVEVSATGQAADAFRASLGEFVLDLLRSEAVVDGSHDVVEHVEYAIGRDADDAQRGAGDITIIVLRDDAKNLGDIPEQTAGILDQVKEAHSTRLEDTDHFVQALLPVPRVVKHAVGIDNVEPVSLVRKLQHRALLEGDIGDARRLESFAGILEADLGIVETDARLRAEQAPGSRVTSAATAGVEHLLVGQRSSGNAVSLEAIAEQFNWLIPVRGGREGFEQFSVMFTGHVFHHTGFGSQSTAGFGADQFLEAARGRGAQHRGHVIHRAIERAVGLLTEREGDFLAMEELRHAPRPQGGGPRRIAQAARGGDQVPCGLCDGTFAQTGSALKISFSEFGLHR